MTSQSLPAVYEGQPSSHLSEKYFFIPTTQLIEDMGNLGWYVHRATQVNSRVKDPKSVKHQINFRHLSHKDEKVVGDLIPEIIVINSHDGGSCFTLNTGVYRLVCGNGLCVPVGNISNLRIKHKDYTYEKLREQIIMLQDNLPNLVPVIESLQSKVITHEQAVEFVQKAIKLRFKDDGGEYDVKSILRPKRPEDEGMSMWLIFNRVQEKLQKGGFGYTTINGTSRTVRPITAIDQVLNLNIELFQLAIES